MKKDIVNLAKAMLQVQAAVKGMEKNSKVGAGNASYNGTKDQDVKEVFNEQFTKHGLLIMPIDIQETTNVDRWQETDNYGTKTKQSVFTKVTVKYLLVHAESGESIELVGYGHGVDSQDKAAGKATTYALKNCLLYTFLTPVGKIDDTETTHSDQIEVPKTVQVEPKKLKPFPADQYETLAIAILDKKTTLDEQKTKYTFSEAAQKVIKAHYKQESEKRKEHELNLKAASGQKHGKEIEPDIEQ